MERWRWSCCATVTSVAAGVKEGPRTTIGNPRPPVDAQPPPSLSLSAVGSGSGATPVEKLKAVPALAVEVML